MVSALRRGASVSAVSVAVPSSFVAVAWSRGLRVGGFAVAALAVFSDHFCVPVLAVVYSPVRLGTRGINRAVPVVPGWSRGRGRRLRKVAFFAVVLVAGAFALLGFVFKA